MPNPPHQPVRVALALLASLVVGAGCRSSQPLAGGDGGTEASAPATDAMTMPVDATGPDLMGADAPPTTGLDAATEESGGACGEAPPIHAWAAWPMPRPGAPGSAGAAAYDTSTAGLVIDQVTKLVWQRDLSGQTFDWQQAKEYCACLSLGGHDDWRLPARIELVTLADYTRANPAIDPAAFPGTPNEWFWSSSPQVGSDPAAAWYVAYFDGNTHRAGLDRSYHVRCVRGGSAAVATTRPAYTVTGADTVADPRTGLTWQRTLEGNDRVFTFAEAKPYCAGLKVAGGGWRLPDMKELQTIIDESRFDPAIDATAFPDTPSEGFWASHTLVETPGFAWFVSFEGGIAYNSPEISSHRVRCVR